MSRARELFIALKKGMHRKGPWARGVRVAVIAHQLRMDEISLSKTTTWNQLEEDKFSFTPTEIQLAFSWVNGQYAHSSTTSRIFFSATWLRTPLSCVPSLSFFFCDLGEDSRLEPIMPQKGYLPFSTKNSNALNGIPLHFHECIAQETKLIWLQNMKMFFSYQLG